MRLQLKINNLVQHVPYTTEINDPDSPRVSEPIWVTNIEVACPVHGIDRTKVT